MYELKNEFIDRERVQYLESNKDDVKSAVDGLAQFCHSWCMNCAETERTGDLVFRCKECPFQEEQYCKVKIFVLKHGTEEQKNTAFSTS